MKRPDHFFLCFSLIALLGSIAGAASAADQFGFRTDGTGRYPDAKPPTTWSEEKNIAWKTDLGGWSNATPTIVGDRIFVTVEPLKLVCLNRKDGKELWSAEHDYKEVKIDSERPKSHGTNGWASATPVSDGENVYVLFGNGVAASYDVSGKRRWIRLVDRPGHRWGHSASPVLAGDVLVLSISQLIGLDPETGKDLWRISSKESFGTPAVARIGREAVVISCAGQIVRAVDGMVLAEDLGYLEYNQPLVEDGVVYFMATDAKAYRLPDQLPDLVDQGKEKLDLEPLWEGRLRRDRYYASPVLCDGKIYSMTRYFILTVLAADTGKKLWEARLGASASEGTTAPPEAEAQEGGRRGRGGERGSRGGGRRQRRGSRGGDTVYSSLTLAGSTIFTCSESGRVFTLSPGNELKVLGENKLPTMRACPVFDGDRMYARAGDALYCISTK